MQFGGQNTVNQFFQNKNEFCCFNTFAKMPKRKVFYVDFINGVEEHVHCLLTLKADMSIAQTMQLIKGEAAYWANKEHLFAKKLYWADEYFAASVSESQLEKVRNYIKNQEQHHQKKTYQ